MFIKENNKIRGNISKGKIISYSLIMIAGITIAIYSKDLAFKKDARAHFSIDPEATIDLKKTEAHSTELTEVLKAMTGQGSVTEQKYVDFASRIFAYKKQSIIGFGLPKDPTIDSKWNKITIDAPFHIAITGNSKHTYSFNPEDPKFCLTQFDMIFMNGEKLSAPEKSSFIKFRCDSLAPFTNGKIFPKSLDEKIPLYKISKFTDNYYALSRVKIVKNAKSGTVSVFVNMNQVKGETAAGNQWNFAEMKKEETPAVVVLGEGQKKEGFSFFGVTKLSFGRRLI